MEKLMLKRYLFLLLILSYLCHAFNETSSIILQNLISQFNRPVTVLEFTNTPFSTTYFSRCSLLPQDSIFVLLNSNIKLTDIPKAAHVICLSRNLTTISPLQLLSEVENFDITVAENIVERFGNKWQQAITALLHMGPYIIFDSIDSDDINQNTITEYLNQYNIFYDTMTHKTIYYIHMLEPQRIPRNHCLEVRRKPSDIHTIISDFNKKTLIKKLAQFTYTIESIWHPGINLVTFKMYGGIYPPMPLIKESILTLTKIPHADWGPNNMVVQANKVILIDLDPPCIKPKDIGKSHSFVNNLLRWIDMTDWRELGHFFWTNLFHRQKYSLAEFE
jgi:hypothetical protein